MLRIQVLKPLSGARQGERRTEEAIRKEAMKKSRGARVIEWKEDTKYKPIKYFLLTEI